MVRLSGQQGVPVIVVDGQVIVGFDRPRLEQAIAASSSGRASAGARQAGTRVQFGASIADATTILRKQGQIPVFGAYVGRVTPGSPAQQAGLQPGDVITELNLRPIARAEDVSTALGGLRPGDTLVVVFQRGDRAYRAETAV